jgi:Toastrack DUF4097
MSGSFRVLATALGVLAGSVLLVGCVTRTSVVQARDTVELSLAAARGTPVRVETFNGGIEVRTVAGEGVAASVVRSGGGRDEQAAEADRDAIEVTLDEIEGTVVLRAVYTRDPDSIPPGTGAAVTLSVPAETPLELRTSNGPIAVSGTSGGLEAHTSNAAIELRGVAGAASVESSNGPITLVSDEAVSVDLGTSNGGITFDARLLPGDSSFETSNGPIDLRLPPDATFTIDAVTSGGSTPTTDFDLDGVVADGSMQGTVGVADGVAETSLEVHTSNGPITISSD